MKKSLFEIVAEGDEDGLRKALEAGEERNAATLAVSIFPRYASIMKTIVIQENGKTTKVIKKFLLFVVVKLKL